MRLPALLLSSSNLLLDCLISDLSADRFLTCPLFLRKKRVHSRFSFLSFPFQYAITRFSHRTGIIYLYQMKAVHTKLFKVNAVRRAQYVTHTFIFGNCFTPTISVRQQCHIKEPLAVGAVMLTPACSADTLILYHIFCPCRYPRQGTFLPRIIRNVMEHMHFNISTF